MQREPDSALPEKNPIHALKELIISCKDNNCALSHLFLYFKKIASLREYYKDNFLDIYTFVCSEYSFFPRQLFRELNKKEKDELFALICSAVMPLDSQRALITTLTQVEEFEQYLKKALLELSTTLKEDNFVQILSQVSKCFSIEIANKYNNSNFSEVFEKTFERFHDLLFINATLSHSVLNKFGCLVKNYITNNHSRSNDALIEYRFYATYKMWTQDGTDQIDKLKLEHYLSTLPKLACEHLENFITNGKLRSDAEKFLQAKLTEQHEQLILSKANEIWEIGPDEIRKEVENQFNANLDVNRKDVKGLKTLSPNEVDLTAKALLKIKIEALSAISQDKDDKSAQLESIKKMISIYQKNYIAIVNLFSILRKNLTPNQLNALFQDTTMARSIVERLRECNKENFLSGLNDFCYEYGIFPINVLEEDEIKFIVRQMFSDKANRTQNQFKQIQTQILLLNSLATIKYLESHLKHALLEFSAKASLEINVNILIYVGRLLSLEINDNYDKDSFSVVFEEIYAHLISYFSLNPSISNSLKSLFEQKVANNISQNVNRENFSLFEYRFYADSMWKNNEDTQFQKFEHYLATLPQLARMHLENFISDEKLRSDAEKILKGSNPEK